MKPLGTQAIVNRRHLLLAGMASIAPLPNARAAARTLPASTNLPQELQQALAKREPLVVMVSLHGCSFCEVVRNNYLGPMHEREGLQVVQIDMLEQRATVDLTGQATTHGALVRAWGVKVAPTVLFFGKGGAEVAPRLAGGDNDFYSGLLDRRLETARKALNG